MCAMHFFFWYYITNVLNYQFQFDRNDFGCLIYFVWFVFVCAKINGSFVFEHFVAIEVELRKLMCKFFLGNNSTGELLRIGENTDKTEHLLNRPCNSNTM